ncbi:MAG: DNA-formamidopyrimidine glycosylase [Chloroflexota bacterium]
MPELPEVETIVRGLREPLVGRTVTGFWTDWPNHVVTPEPDALAMRIRGRTFQSIGRRGKYLVFELDQDEVLIIHLKMSGQLSVQEQSEPADRYVHTTFRLEGGHELRFRDVRKFGRVYLVTDRDRVLGQLGPEPLSDDFTVAWLEEQLGRRRRVLKPLLLDQTFIAGIGNIYADEALFLAAIRPDRHSNSLTGREIAALHEAIQVVLRLGIERQGASIDSAYRQPDGSGGQMQDLFVAYGRAGQDCLRCQGTIERIVLGGRSTHFCSNCQF